MSTVLSKAAEASSTPATASEPAPAQEGVAAEATQPATQPGPESEQEPDPEEPPMPEAPVPGPETTQPPPEPDLRMDGPTPSEWVAAGYPAAAYPPRGYAAKPDDVEHYRVTRHCRYFHNSTVSTWPEGQVIDSLNFNIADVRAQGLPIERCAADAKNLTPSIGHWSK